MGVPLSRFDGAVGTERTRHTYDDTGRLVESVTTRSPEWTPTDRQWALAWVEYQRQLCPNCGGWMEDCAYPDGAEDKPTYRALDPMPCQRSVVTNVKRGEYTDHPHVGAFLWRTEATFPRG